jgi:futalosine hydrolase
MKILIVAATKFEIRPLCDKMTFRSSSGDNLSHFTLADHEVDVLIAGVGIAPTAYHLGKQLSQSEYALAINAGICGSYSDVYSIGKVVNVAEEVFSELGVESAGRFFSLFDVGLLDPDEPPYREGRLINNSEQKSATLRRLPKTKGITANTVHGDPAGVVRMNRLFHPDVESMEGAAFFYSCMTAGVPFHQVRSISNFVIERDKSKWDIPAAVTNLTSVVFQILMESMG